MSPHRFKIISGSVRGGITYAGQLLAMGKERPQASA